MSVDRGEGLEVSVLEVALVIDVTSNIIKNPLRHTRVRKEGETILEKQSVSNKQHHLSIPALYLQIGGLHSLEPNPVVHIPPIGGLISQMVITVLQNGLRKDGRKGSGGDHGSRRRRHCWLRKEAEG